jgi:hypothetical protein
MFNPLLIGILIGVPVGAFAPEWLKILTFVIALLFSGLLVEAQGASRNIHDVHFSAHSWLIGIVGIAFGLWALHYARRRGLQQLGKAELGARWRTVRGISKWGW